MLLIGTKNTTTQNLLTNSLVDIGSVYRRFSKKNCNTRTFDTTSNSITLNSSGIYHVTITAIVSAPAAGDVTLSLFENGTVIPGAIATETITTATTEFHTATIDYYILVDSACVLGNRAVNSKTLTLVNTGVGSTITNIVFNVEKVVG